MLFSKRITLLLTSTIAVLFCMSTAYAEVQNLVTINPDASSPGCEESLTCFVPNDIVINKGESVHWKNTASTSHAITSGEPMAGTPGTVFESGFLPSGDSYSNLFSETGTYSYFCLLHPWMAGNVHVVDHNNQKQSEPAKSCADPRIFFSKEIIHKPIFEDFENYCRYVKNLQDENFAYKVEMPKKPEKSMYGIVSDNAKGTKSLVALISVDREHDKNSSITNIGATHHGILHVASFDRHLVTLSADVYADNLNGGGSPAAGARAITGITYHTGDDFKTIGIVSHYNGDHHGGKSFMDIGVEHATLFVDDKKSQRIWKHLEYDVRELYNKNGFGNYDADVTSWSLSIGGWAYVSTMSKSTWQVNLDNLIVSDGTNMQHIPSPIYQRSVGIEPHDVMCPTGKSLALKISNSEPICVNDSSLDRVFEMGLAIPGNPDATKNISKKITSDKKYFTSLLKDHILSRAPTATTYSIDEMIQYVEYTKYKSSILDKVTQSYNLEYMMWDSDSLEESIQLDSATVESARSSFRESGESSGSFILNDLTDEDSFRLEYTDMGGKEHSTTNIHVIGVDEPDFVKNNAENIHVISGDGNIATVDASLKKYSKVLSQNIIGDVEPRYMLLHEEKLVVLSDGTDGTDITTLDMSQQTPKVISHLFVDAPLYKARMINDVIYIMTESNLFASDGPVTLYDKGTSKIIHTAPMTYFTKSLNVDAVLNTITAINLTDIANSKSTSYVLGSSDTTYVTNNNIYFTQNYPYPNMKNIDKAEVILVEYLIDQMEPYQLVSLYDLKNNLDNINDDIIKNKMIHIILNTYDIKHRESLYKLATDAIGDDFFTFNYYDNPTAIHKIAIDGTNVKYVTSGSVTGDVSDQFALDEKDGHLRIVTTTWNTGRQTNVHVLDENLSMVGLLEGIAPGETLHSTRFSGDWLYIVTFRQVDPFFVIDVSTTQPEILGELKIPGFSEYLQNYDDTHVIGIGRDTGTNMWGGTDILGIKISMFDVTDFDNPVETDNVVIGDWQTDSASIVEHKSILLDKQKKLLSIPVTSNGKLDFFVYTINDNYTFDLHSKIPHELDTQKPNHMRSLYIGDTLYTVTPKMIKANNINEHNQTLDSILLVR